MKPLKGLRAVAGDPVNRAEYGEKEQLILVDGKDREIGFDSKKNCHDSSGILHRAFSLFVFNSNNQLLLQQRSAQKRLWPLYWSNSCCSHPRRGETMTQAIGRRVQEELGMGCSSSYLYKFEYHASFGTEGSEHELCWVFAGQSDEPVKANNEELNDWRWVTAEELDEELEAHPDRFTPWFKLEWPRVREILLDIDGRYRGVA
ncbi:MAG TPA: isopentenyl-diphosphate Delta-isomerase [Xanthomonadales bacterium]|nr:isopentenyl-diphosphate Delta-isomerase [Xanthomonadales bacterium]